MKTMKAEKKLKRVYVTVTLPERIKEQLDQLALRTKRNRGACIELALEQFLKQTN
jgi:predicted transcriptional regulator